MPRSRDVDKRALLQNHLLFSELDGRPRSADAVATKDCELFVIERRDFLPVVKEEPEILPS